MLACARPFKHWLCPGQGWSAGVRCAGEYCRAGVCGLAGELHWLAPAAGSAPGQCHFTKSARSGSLFPQPAALLEFLCCLTLPLPASPESLIPASHLLTPVHLNLRGWRPEQRPGPVYNTEPPVECVLLIYSASICTRKITSFVCQSATFCTHQASQCMSHLVRMREPSCHAGHDVHVFSLKGLCL